MFCIRIGNIDELGKVKDFYNSLIEEMQEAKYKPGWKKDIYPTMEMLREALEKGELYIGEEEGKTASCMILNRTCNERYQEISWPMKAEPDQVLAVHTFGVHPRFSGRGLGKRMIEEAVKMAANRGMKAIRLDVLEGNLPAEKLYQKVGFLKKCIDDKDRYDFLIFSPQGKIIWESVLNEIDRELKLHRVELDVFSFNPRAIRAYEKAGFRREGVLRDAVKDGDKYGDDILMAILEEEWE